MRKKRRKNFNYLRKLKSELNEVSKEHDIDIELLKVLIDEVFYDIRKLVTSSKMPSITLSSFGTFRPSAYKVNFLLTKRLKFLRKSRTSTIKEKETTIEFIKKEIKKLWAVKQRFIAERRGIRTWKCWLDLDDDLKNYQECHKATFNNCLKCRRKGTVQTQEPTRET